jgi:hypothetical protein
MELELEWEREREQEWELEREQEMEQERELEREMEREQGLERERELEQEWEREREWELERERERKQEQERERELEPMTTAVLGNINNWSRSWGESVSGFWTWVVTKPEPKPTWGYERMINDAACLEAHANRKGYCK